MEFHACIVRPGQGVAAAARIVKESAARAQEWGLTTLRHGEADLPVWVDRPTEWQVAEDPEGGIIVSGAGTAAPGPGGFRALAAGDVTAPLLHLAADGGGSVACDPIGISTVYWREIPGAILASSHSGRLVPRTERRIDLLAAFHFLNFSYVPTPHSILRGVVRLAPGCRVEAGSAIRTEVLRDLTYGHSGPAPKPQELLEAIRSAVGRATTLVDPAALGSFLSGGTDSTSVAGLATEGLGGPLDVFSIVFDDPRYSEEVFMRAAESRFLLRRHSFRLDEKAFMGALEPILEAYDEPYANSSVFAAYYCFQMARDLGKKVLLTGDGGDEIFGGNERYLKDRIFTHYRAIPRWARSLWERPLALLPDSIHLANRFRKIFRRAELQNPDRFYADDEFASLYWERLRGPAFRDAPFGAGASLEHLRTLYRASTASDEIDRLLYLDMKGTIADNDLRKIVRCGSIFGIRSRFPLLDPTLVEYANHLPASLKLKGTEIRYWFKQAMRGFLPDLILFKKKHGMGIPLHSWIRSNGPLAEYVRARLTGTAARDLFDPAFMEQLWDEHRRKVWEHGDVLWRMVVLTDWCERHGGGRQ